MTLDAQLNKLNAQVSDILTNQYNNHSQHAMVSEAQVLGEISSLLGIINTMWPMLKHSISAYKSVADEFERLPKTAKNPKVYFEKAQAFFNSLEEGIKNMGNGGDGSAQGFYDGLVGGAQPGTVHQMAIMVYDVQKATKNLTALQKESDSDGNSSIVIYGNVQASTVNIGNNNTVNMGSSGVSVTQRKQIYNSPLIVMARGANLTVSYDPDIKRVISVLPRTGAPALEDGYTGVVDLGNMNNARYDIILSNNSSLIVIGPSNQISFYNDTNPAGKVNVTTIGTNNLFNATGYESQIKQLN